MKSAGLVVDRPIAPTSLELSKDEKVLKDPTAHAVRVRKYQASSWRFFAFIFHQVVLKRLDAAEGQVDTEIVHAKFVVGADGWSF